LPSVTQPGCPKKGPGVGLPISERSGNEKFLLAPQENLQRAQAFWANPAVLKQIRRQQ